MTEWYRFLSQGMCRLPDEMNHAIAWIDPEFKEGDFGTVLRGVPGNTEVKEYKTILNSMYCLIEGERPGFELDTQNDDNTCPLWMAAEPLQYVTTELRKKIYSAEGFVQSIKTTSEGFLELFLSSQNSTITAEEVILLVGAEPKKVDLGLDEVHPNILFTQENLRNYLSETKRENKKFAIVGSSHSAALAVMHLLQEGIPVKQFMNKAYRFAEKVVEGDVKRTKYDNTGLKGEVALFTKKLLHAKGKDQGLVFTEAEEKNYKRYAALWECDDEGPKLVYGDERLLGCSHIGVCIGYQSRSSLTIDENPLSSFNYNPQTGELISESGERKAHIHVSGIAHPEEKVFPEGNEFVVGVSKFSSSARKIIQKIEA